MLGESPRFKRSVNGLCVALTDVDKAQPLRRFHLYCELTLFIDDFTFALDTAFGNSRLKER